MKALDIIKEMCTIGCTEGMGIITSDLDGSSIREFINIMFGSNYKIKEGTLYNEKTYIYSFAEPLSKYSPDMLLENEEGEEVYIYLIEL